MELRCVFLFCGGKFLSAAPICIGYEAPEVLVTIEAAVHDIEKDWRKDVGDTDLIVVSGLSNDGEEGCFGISVG